MFVALRFIVGPANRREQEGIARKGVRVATNYIIKQFYQQMFFFLTPLYASSATWSLSSCNWWLAPAAAGVRRGVDDGPRVRQLHHGAAVARLGDVRPRDVLAAQRAAAAGRRRRSPDRARRRRRRDAASVALLSFSVRQVLSPQGALLTVGSTVGLLGVVWYGRAFIPPAPLAMPEIAVGHGTLGIYECMPGSTHEIRANQLDGLRCGSLLREPGGLKEDVVHVWSYRGTASWRS